MTVSFRVIGISICKFFVLGGNELVCTENNNEILSFEKTYLTLIGEFFLKCYWQKSTELENKFSFFKTTLISANCLLSLDLEPTFTFLKNRLVGKI